MIDIEKHVYHWRTGAEEDLVVAKDLINSSHIRHGLFFLHLCLEKLLKAHVCHATKDLAPPIHNLPRLARLASLTFESEQNELLADLNSFNIEGRYPELLNPSPSKIEATDYLAKVEDMYLWLTNQF